MRIMSALWLITSCNVRLVLYRFKWFHHMYLFLLSPDRWQCLDVVDTVNATWLSALPWCWCTQTVFYPEVFFILRSDKLMTNSDMLSHLYPSKLLLVCSHSQSQGSDLCTPVVATSSSVFLFRISACSHYFTFF